MRPPRPHLRISVLCGASYVSGLEIMALAVIEGLKERGHVVHVVVNGWNDGDFPARLNALSVPHTPAFLGKISLSPRPKYLRWTADALRRLPSGRAVVRRHVRTFQPDVVLSFNVSTLALIGDLVRSVPVVSHVHEVPGRGLTSTLLLPLARRPIRTCVAVSEYTAGELERLGFADVRVVLNGLDIPDHPLGARAIRDVEGGGLRVGIVGQVGAWKGHEDFVEALSLLGRRGVEVEGHVFGRGDDAFVREVRERAERAGVAVTWHGFVSDQNEIYPHLNVLVAPSRAVETFGLVAAEAGLHGLPAVVTRRGGLPEVVVDGETGLVVEAESPTELADALERLARDPDLRHRLGRAGRERAMRAFSKERMVAGVEDVLRSVAPGGGTL